MEMDALWNVGLTAGFGFIVWQAKSQREELGRVTILLNKTREELGRDYVSKADSNQVLLQIMNKFDRIEEKIDRLMEK